jgi:hypothetical protein
MRSRQDSSHLGQNPAQLLPFGSREAALSFNWSGLGPADEGDRQGCSAVDLGSAERES